MLVLKDVSNLAQTWGGRVPSRQVPYRLQCIVFKS